MSGAEARTFAMARASSADVEEQTSGRHGSRGEREARGDTEQDSDRLDARRRRGGRIGIGRPSSNHGSDRREGDEDRGLPEEPEIEAPRNVKERREAGGTRHRCSDERSGRLVPLVRRGEVLGARDAELSEELERNACT